MGNGFRAGLEVAGVPEKIPTIGPFTGVAEIIGGVVNEPWLAGGNREDSIDFPALQQLAEALLPRKGVAGFQSEAMARVVVAIAIFFLRVGAVLWKSAETSQRTIVETMTIRVTSGEINAMRNALGQGCLEAVVV